MSKIISDSSIIEKVSENGVYLSNRVPRYLGNAFGFNIDEGIDKYFQREKGRAIRGQKVEDTKRGRRFQRTNVVGGLCDGKYWAVECYNHTTNSSFFENWFEKNLLCEVPQNYTIVMDNARFHRKEKLYQLAKNVGVNLLFLPAYSPDFNPIGS